MNPIDLDSGRRVDTEQKILKLLRAQVKLLQVVAVLQGIILFIGLLILLYWMWK